MGSSTQFIINFQSQSNNNNAQSFETSIEPTPFKRWESLVKENGVDSENYRNHKKFILEIAQKSLEEIKSLPTFAELKCLSGFFNYELPLSSESGRVKLGSDKNAVNIFEAIFILNQTLSSKEKIELAEHFIVQLGYLQLLKFLRKEENQAVIQYLFKQLPDPDYLEFIQRLYIALCRQEEKDRGFRLDAAFEDQVFSAIAEHTKDGGKQFFENLIFDNNLPENKLYIFVSGFKQGGFWSEYLISKHMQNFIRGIVLHFKLDDIARVYPVMASDENTHQEFLAILCELKKYKGLYKYVQTYLEQFQEYNDVLQAYNRLIQKLPNETHQAVKKYTDLQILEISKMKSAAAMSSLSKSDQPIPKEVDAFLNPGDSWKRKVHPCSAYSLAHRLFEKTDEERKNVQEQLKEKKDRIITRLELEGWRMSPK